MIDAIDMLRKLKDSKDTNTVYAHYGFKSDEMYRFTNEMLVDLIQSDNITTVIDRHFKGTDGRQRLNIFCFALALGKFHKLTD